MLWQYVEHLRLMILVHGDAPPSDPDWEVYASELHRIYPQGKLRRVLVFSDGPGPNASQRQRLHHNGVHPLQTAVVTHALLARGIVTALSWFYEIRAFAPTALDAAFSYLTIPQTEWTTIRKTVATLRMQLSEPAAPAQSFELTETIGKLDELVTDRLPRLRERMKRASDVPPRSSMVPRKPLTPRTG